MYFWSNGSGPKEMALISIVDVPAHIALAYRSPRRSSRDVFGSNPEVLGAEKSQQERQSIGCVKLLMMICI